jgi:hypothetical protein
LTGLSRPTLAILNEDYPKVKSIESKQEINGLINYLITILNIKVSSEEEKLQLDKQMILIFDLIKTKFGSLTVPEIKEAFKMFVSGEFPELKVFRMLDCIVVSDVLNAFKDYRSDILRGYDQKKKLLLEQPKPKIEEEIKQTQEVLIKMVFDDLNTSGFSSDAWLLYDKLDSNGFITISNQEKKELYAQQAKIYLVEVIQESEQRYFKSAKFVIEDARNKISKGKIIQSVANKCKSIVVCNFLKNYLTDFEEFRNKL